MSDYGDADSVQLELPDEQLTTFSGPWVRHNSPEITLTFPEFRHLCPVSERPDHAELTIAYTADERVIEEKSLRDYLFAFSDCAVWHERAVVAIKERMLTDAAPQSVTIKATFEPRGNITTSIVERYSDD